LSAEEISRRCNNVNRTFRTTSDDYTTPSTVRYPQQDPLSSYGPQVGRVSRYSQPISYIEANLK